VALTTTRGREPAGRRGERMDLMADRDPGPWQLAGEVGFTVTFGRGLDPGATLAAYGADPASARALTHTQARDALPTGWGRPLLRAGMLAGAGAAPAPLPPWAFALRSGARRAGVPRCWPPCPPAAARGPDQPDGPRAPMPLATR
jgi:hypothetical protein